jgi:hypothetical protein
MEISVAAMAVNVPSRPSQQFSELAFAQIGISASRAIINFFILQVFTVGLNNVLLAGNA